MLFSSTLFIYIFLPIVLAVYFIVPKKHVDFRNAVLLIASLVFYAWGEPIYVALMIYSIIFNYFMALEIAREKKRGGSGKINFVFTVIVNLFILCFFKYYGFLMDNINSWFNLGIRYSALSLPIGISFYTFQALSYIIDVYRGRVRAQGNLLRFAVYLSLFPQLIAGPIVKYRDIETRLRKREITFSSFGQGAERFVFGLGKKVLLANNLGALHQAVTALSADQQSTAALWIGITAYTMQIYFDFSGYSDMAIGLGKMFGFDFLENFEHPYISRSVTEFWRRWHISLSSWFREYLYIPLGGNRVTVPRHMLNLMIVWGLTGLWHGASWNFVFWGMYYGILLILEKYIWGSGLEKLPKVFGTVITMILVMIGWVFFSSPDLTSAFGYLGGMFGIGSTAAFNGTSGYLIKTNAIMLVIGLIFCGPGPYDSYKKLSEKVPVVPAFTILLIMILSTAYLVYSSYNPFLYFRF